MERLKEEAGRRAGIAQRKQLQEEEQKRLKKVGRDQGCIAFPDGDEMGLETGGTYHCASQIQEDSASCGLLLRLRGKRLPMGNNGSGRKSGGGGQIPEGGYRMQRYGASDGDSG